MKVLVIGLGSMGRRRIRLMQTLPNFVFTSLEEGIAKQITWQKGYIA